LALHSRGDVRPQPCDSAPQLRQDTVTATMHIIDDHKPLPTDIPTPYIHNHSKALPTSDSHTHSKPQLLDLYSDDDALQATPQLQADQPNDRTRQTDGDIQSVLEQLRIIRDAHIVNHDSEYKELKSSLTLSSSPDVNQSEEYVRLSKAEAKAVYQ